MRNSEVVIAGAGIVGVTCGIELRRAGFEVAIVDPGHHDSAPSAYNAGGLGYAEMLPLASGNVLRKVPRWLTSSTGPLAIRPAYMGTLLPWLMRFVRAARKSAFLQGITATAELNRLSRSACRPLYDRAGLGKAIRTVGALHLYESQREMERSMVGWGLRATQGVKFEHVTADELITMEPALTPVFAGATFIEDWHLVSDPKAVLDGLTNHARELGVTFVRDGVQRILTSTSRPTVRLDDGGMKADRVVIAAGAWSGRLAAALGDKVPLEAERGYNTTFSNPGIAINSELIFGEHGFVATQLDSGLRIGGGAEFAGLDHPPNFARADAMIAVARRFLPGLAAGEGTAWMGSRPSLPDNRPVIGCSRHDRRILYAFGHGHLGLTQAPGTARLVTNLATERLPEIDISPYSARRFG